MPKNDATVNIGFYGIWTWKPLKSSHEKRGIKAGESDPRDVPFNLYGGGYTV